MEFDAESQKLGIDLKNITMVDTLDEILKSTPGMVIGFIKNGGTMLLDTVKVHIKPKQALVMTYNMYKKLKLSNPDLIHPHKKKFSDLFKRYNGQNLDNKTLFIWRTGGIGDLCFTQPILKHIKKTYPTCKIIFATSIHNMPILNCFPRGLIDRIISMPFDVDFLNKSHYHLTFEGCIERCKEAEMVNCYDIFMRSAGLDFNIPDYPLEIISNSDKVELFKHIIPKNTIMIQMRASSIIRTMGTFRWAEIIKDLVEKHGYNIGLIDSKKNSNTIDMFIDMYKLDTTKVLNLAKYSTTISDGVAMLDLCDGVIGIDSSFTHIGAGLNKKVFGIYGPFLGILRLKYYKNCDWVDSVNYNECGRWPCFFHDNRLNMCPFVHKKLPVGCLLSISKDEIINDFLKLMKGASNG
jgi:ADP-heptose:LPS heptosyltransferase